MTRKISEQIKLNAGFIEKALDGYLSGTDPRIPGIEEAMRYSVLNGGKRVRPFLAVEFCRLAGGDIGDVVPFACALELIHSYSLVHDDLPCMDDDDLRRGKPTTHVKFGYANALLAGDALLTRAFGVAVSGKCSDAKKCAAVAVLSRAAGAQGMCGGQQLDLYSEDHSIDLETLRYLHSLKTGALIRCACELGCIAAGVEEDAPLRRAAVEYAEAVGVTFQIVDDVLDVTADQSVFGKPVGSDAEQGKTTYLSFMSIDEAKKNARELTDKAISAISSFPGSETLCDFAEYLYSRDR